MRKSFDELGLILVALIFGLAYPFQNIGAQYVEAFSFTAIKNIIALITILPFCFSKTKANRKEEVINGLVIAVILTAFSYLQQVVALNSSSGKIGFITSMYIVEVPVIKFLLYKEKINLQTVLSLIFAVAGLVLLCDLSNFSFNITDLLTILCSLLLALQIIFIEKKCSNCDPFRLNAFSFAFILVFSIIGAIIMKEPLNPQGYIKGIVPLLYVGVGCATIGCTLQTYCQKTLDATTASLILSLESVFSVLGGYFILNETLSKKELLGCVLMFIGVILCVTAQKRSKN